MFTQVLCLPSNTNGMFQQVLNMVEQGVCLSPYPLGRFAAAISNGIANVFAAVGSQQQTDCGADSDASEHQSNFPHFQTFCSVHTYSPVPLATHEAVFFRIGYTTLSVRDILAQFCSIMPAKIEFLSISQLLSSAITDRGATRIAFPNDLQFLILRDLVVLNWFFNDCRP